MFFFFFFLFLIFFLFFLYRNKFAFCAKLYLCRLNIHVYENFAIVHPKIKKINCNLKFKSKLNPAPKIQNVVNLQKLPYSQTVITKFLFLAHIFWILFSFFCFILVFDQIYPHFFVYLWVELSFKEIFFCNIGKFLLLLFSSFYSNPYLLLLFAQKLTFTVSVVISTLE